MAKTVEEINQAYLLVLNAIKAILATVLFFIEMLWLCVVLATCIWSAACIYEVGTTSSVVGILVLLAIPAVLGVATTAAYQVGQILIYRRPSQPVATSVIATTWFTALGDATTSDFIKVSRKRLSFLFTPAPPWSPPPSPYLYPVIHVKRKKKRRIINF